MFWGPNPFMTMYNDIIAILIIVTIPTGFWFFLVNIYYFKAIWDSFIKPLLTVSNSTWLDSSS